MAMKDISDLLVVKAYLERKRIRELHPQANIYPYDLLRIWTNGCDKVCYRAMERAADRDYIEYGASLRTGWVTDKGLRLLND